MRTIKVGSRRSKLAMTQTKWVINKLKELNPSYNFEIREIVTKATASSMLRCQKWAAKVCLSKRLNRRSHQEIDMAVHSMKDMPAVLPEGLVIGRIPKREDPRDALISKGHQKLDDIKKGHHRHQQFKKKRPDSC